MPPTVPHARPAAPPLVLVADDDPRVIESLQLTLTSHHLRVVTALDGDEAIRRALAERPELVVLDARMPGKSGLEVCDWLRHDPEDPQVPIVVLTDGPDADTRLEALARGADDVLVKPFSPKEIVARAKRLLARAQELREQRRRAQQLERELHRAQDESRRAHGELRREQRLRELAFGFGRELHRSLDPDDVAARLLSASLRLLGCGSVALFAADPRTLEGAPFGLLAHAGVESDRFDGLAVEPAGELLSLVAGLGRPVRRAELERLGALAPELAPFAARGVETLVPVRTRAGLEALLVADERADGLAHSTADLELLGALAGLAAPALQNAWRHRAAEDRALELLAARAATRDSARHAVADALELANRACAALALPARERGLVAHAVSLGAWAWSGEGREALDRLVERAGSERLRALATRVASAAELDLPAFATPEAREATLVVAVLVRVQVARASGRSRDEAWTTAVGWASAQLEPRVHEALATAAGTHEPGRAIARPGPGLRAA